VWRGAGKCGEQTLASISGTQLADIRKQPA
jgi:hypothetical protein